VSKPLELTIFPRLERPRTGAEIMPFWEQWRREAALQGSKHLTDADLAAEFHQQDYYCGQKLEGYGVAHNGDSLGSEEEEIERLRILYRFATLPHYDEVDQ
jgi:hypothetical protein